jgi:uncharacterized CHY-type Zn-finger protein
MLENQEKLGKIFRENTLREKKEKPLVTCSVCHRLTTLFFEYDTKEKICPDCQEELNPTTIHWTV